MGTIFSDYASFDKQVDLFRNYKSQIIIARDFAYIRVLMGGDSFFSRNCSRIREGVLYIPKAYSLTGEARKLLIRESLTLLDPVKATDAHRNNLDFIVDEKYAELQEQAGKEYKSPVFEIGGVGDSFAESIPTSSFHHELPRWVFGDVATAYEHLLRKNKIFSMNLSFDDDEYINAQTQPYANQLILNRFIRFKGPDDDSEYSLRHPEIGFSVDSTLIGNRRVLSSDVIAFGKRY